MEPTLILLTLLFGTGLLAGTVDAIAGGGGLISVPVLMAFGLPAHEVLGTNKLQSSIGTFMATLNYFRHGFISLFVIRGGLITVFLGAAAGALLAQALSAAILEKLIIFFLVTIFIYSVCRPAFGLHDAEPKLKESTFFIVFGFILGFYDGFFGPGAGSFWAMGMVYFLGYNLAKATAYTKIFNLESNLVALLFFLLGHNVNFKIGLAMGAGQIIGGKLGSHLVIKKGARFVRPVFLTIVFLTIVVLVYREGVGVGWW